MSKKGPRSDAFNLLTGSLSEEVIAHYLELAYNVREQELARRREIERRKAAIKRAKLAALRTAWEEAARKAGIVLPERPGESAEGKAKKVRSKKGRAKKGVARRPEVAAAAAMPVAVAPPVGAGPATEEASSGEAAAAAAAVAEQPGAAEPPAGAPLQAPVQKTKAVKSRARKPITREDILKLYVADSLGYLDKVRADGWGGLTCAESGRVGGMMTRRMKRLEKGRPLG